ncbi:MAG: hypothetical protein BWY75_02956 [bacterium ADurb.Bin425]|nr:MAG: hypothetical protein BWY75_02956 [bacterium ADurb.Bin425]
MATGDIQYRLQFAAHGMSFLQLTHVLDTHTFQDRQGLIETLDEIRIYTRFLLQFSQDIAYTLAVGKHHCFFSPGHATALRQETFAGGVLHESTHIGIFCFEIIGFQVAEIAHTRILQESDLVFDSLFVGIFAGIFFGYATDNRVDLGLRTQTNKGHIIAQSFIAGHKSLIDFTGKINHALTMSLGSYFKIAYGLEVDEVGGSQSGSQSFITRSSLHDRTHKLSQLSLVHIFQTKHAIHFLGFGLGHVFDGFAHKSLSPQSIFRRRDRQSLSFSLFNCHKLFSEIGTLTGNFA